MTAFTAQSYAEVLADNGTSSRNAYLRNAVGSYDEAAAPRSEESFLSTQPSTGLDGREERADGGPAERRYLGRIAVLSGAEGGLVEAEVASVHLWVSANCGHAMMAANGTIELQCRGESPFIDGCHLRRIHLDFVLPVRPRSGVTLVPPSPRQSSSSPPQSLALPYDAPLMSQDIMGNGQWAEGSYQPLHEGYPNGDTGQANEADRERERRNALTMLVDPASIPTRSVYDPHLEI